ncbi:MAG: type II toxin-antitoxin system RelE/ParE family toxin [Clostridiales bacterium]|jgi:hypothetical protein|nr:type II toxin-antitoxin system RelE/ParE family toxin [Clostridiales bacterium]
MLRQFVETTIFSKRWLELGLDDDDLLELQKYLMKNPTSGNIIIGTGGARKLRFALPNKGKRGGVRVIYVDVLQDEQIHLLLCYAKSKQGNLTETQRQQLKALIKIIKR